MFSLFFRAEPILRLVQFGWTLLHDADTTFWVYMLVLVKKRKEEEKMVSASSKSDEQGPNSQELMSQL